MSTPAKAPTPLEFHCPRCNGSRLEEVMDNVTVMSRIFVHEVDGELADVNYGDQTNENGEIIQFQCVKCGAVILTESGSTINTYEGLFAWLKSHQP